MPLYLVEVERISVRKIEVEAESALEAREKVSAMSEYQLESEPEDDHHWQFGWDPVRVNEDLQPIGDDTDAKIVDALANPISVRLGGDELFHNLMAGDGHHQPVETCQ